MARLIDVAREAGVSPGAASSVLGGRPGTIGTSEETRRRILEAAERLAYTPNPAAVSLSTGRTNTLGLLLSNPAAYLTHPNGALTLVSICSSAAELDYRVLLAAFTPETSIDVRLMDACIVFGWVDDACAIRVEELARQIPVVVTYRRIPGAVFVVAAGAGVAGFTMAAEHLYDLGHRDIAVTSPAHASQSAIAEFRAVAQRRNLDVRLTEFTDEWRKRMYPSVEQICSLDPLPTAVFAFDDDYSRALVARLARDRRRVPEDVSVFSGETHRAGFQTPPALTGIAAMQERKYAAIVRNLIEALREGDTIRELAIEATPVELVVRASCAPPPQR